MVSPSQPETQQNGATLHGQRTLPLSGQLLTMPSQDASWVLIIQNRRVVPSQAGPSGQEEPEQPAGRALSALGRASESYLRNISAVVDISDDSACMRKRRVSCGHAGVDRQLHQDLLQFIA
jgi:hypothetical protein